ncbi:hypothetical protein [Rhodococcus sp. NPDC127528]|uniref:hypothetical protein n=1 Tax=unclassified Rhodococcus (in: high G+C Gram-positive bacteria) TaxID=192944 RepID=UPI00363C90AF
MVAPITMVGWFFIGVVFGEKDQATKLHSGMQETLHRLAAAAVANESRKYLSD